MAGNKFEEANGFAEIKFSQFENLWVFHFAAKIFKSELKFKKDVVYYKTNQIC